MECVIDTNVLVYDMMEDSDLHAQAKTIIDSIDTRTIPMIVIEELAHVLSQLKVERAVISKKIRELSATENIVSQSLTDVAEAANLLDREGASFERFNDKLILSVAKGKNIPLVTFDKELIKECKANGIRLLYK